MTPGRLLRAVRAAMFAAVCVLLAAVGHVLMSGTDLPWWALLSAFAGTACAAWCPAGRERGLPTVTAAAVVVQAVLHTVFSASQSVLHPSPPTGTSFVRQWAESITCGAGSAGAMSFEDALRIVTDAGLGGMVTQPPPGTTMGAAHGAGHHMAGASSAGMLAVHLLAAVLCGLWLAYAEQGAFRLLRALAHWLRVPLRLLSGLLARTPHRPRVRPARDLGTRMLRGRLLVHSLASRGPPTGTAVL
ncbi:hypothetical protein [Streptomyces sp. NPDC001880]